MTAVVGPDRRGRRVLRLKPVDRGSREQRKDRESFCPDTLLHSSWTWFCSLSPNVSIDKYLVEKISLKSYDFKKGLII